MDSESNKEKAFGFSMAGKYIARSSLQIWFQIEDNRSCINALEGHNFDISVSCFIVLI